MKALTLHGIHAWSIVYGGKDIENRTWVPPDRLVGQRIAIHAGLTVGGSPADLRWRCPNVPQQFPRGEIVGTVLLQGYVRENGRTSPGLSKAQLRAAKASPWGGGECMWILADPQPLAKPLRCSGRLGLWEAPDLESGGARQSIGLEELKGHKSVRHANRDLELAAQRAEEEDEPEEAVANDNVQVHEAELASGRRAGGTSSPKRPSRARRSRPRADG